MTGSFGRIARSPCPAGTYGERPFPAVGKSAYEGTAASGPEITQPRPGSWLKARIRLMVLCPPPIASPWSIPWSAISVTPGRIFSRAPERSAASFFPFSRSVAASYGDFAARISRTIGETSSGFAPGKTCWKRRKVPTGRTSSSNPMAANAALFSA